MSDTGGDSHFGGKMPRQVGHHHDHDHDHYDHHHYDRHNHDHDHHDALADENLSLANTCLFFFFNKVENLYFGGPNVWVPTFDQFEFFQSPIFWPYAYSQCITLRRTKNFALNRS